MKNEVPERLKVVIRGAVQGVGFRPFVYRLAAELSLNGWVSNSSQGVFIEVEGLKPQLDEFLFRITRDKPPLAFIQSLESAFLDTVGYGRFEIRHSDDTGPKSALVLPDIAVCPDCLADVLDPANRRYQYPFTNCTNCGPRYTIIERLPYDRAGTTMSGFSMCPECRGEYEDPRNRRFHAQPNACPVCGPQLALWDAAGRTLATRDEALAQAAGAIRDGKIVAVKGIGGFHLMCDAGNDGAVDALRIRKHREEKPFALMFPSLELIERYCSVTDTEARLLVSPEAPIVLLARADAAGVGKSISDHVAPGNPYLGILLPYTPLHHLLLLEVGGPVVATSGNISDEPICINEHEALERLAGIADVFLVHDRHILRHADDSIVRVALDRVMVLRRARGFAPLPVALPEEPSVPVLAVGAHLKNTAALTVGRNAFISQHIGDLETEEALRAFRRVIKDLSDLFATLPAGVAADSHPDYLSCTYAANTSLPLTAVQHHYAHVASCMAENQLAGSLLGVSWDGTGYGGDGTIWGGEFLRTIPCGFERVAAFRTFPLPGGEAAVKEPRRVALGLLFEMDPSQRFEGMLPQVSDAFSVTERNVLRRMLEAGTNAPQTSSAGRLFDAVASLIGIRQVMRHEGQAAMELEWAAGRSDSHDAYTFAVQPSTQQSMMRIDWEPAVRELLSDLLCQRSVPDMARKFHNGLAEAIAAVAKVVQESRIVLTGGCFQNIVLLTETVRRLQIAGFRPYWHQRVPPNDGGIALGQVFAVLRREHPAL